LREAELGADHVDDALLSRAPVEKFDAVLFGVFVQGFQHGFRQVVGEGAGGGVGRHDVVYRREGTVRPSDP
jgi:hypothetical protein